MSGEKARVTLADVPTPALVLDVGLLAGNCERMLRTVHARGVRLRTHVKTLKSVDAARQVIDPSHGGIAVSTLAEAETFTEAGFSDVQLAVVPSPGQAHRIAALSRRTPGFSVFLDSLETARSLAEAAAQASSVLRVWIELDCGEHRTGVAPDGEALLPLAKAIDTAPALRLVGVATHAGHVYAARTLAQVRSIAEEEREAVVSAAERLRSEGFAIEGVSAGSTPTALHASSSRGLTELRAGVFPVGDLFQAGVGSLREDQIALSVLSTVISRRADLGQVVIDAGGLALSKDRSTATLARDAGYGLVTDLDGRPAYGHLTVSEVHQEHGEVRGLSEETLERLPVGARVRVFPNHACMTAAMYDCYHVVDGGRELRTVWTRKNGW